jgi:hypothetical protein
MIAAVLMVFMSPIGLRLHSACRAGLVTSIIGRLAWAIPMAGLAALTMHDVHGLLLAPFLFAALTLPDFDSSDMGRVNGSRVGDGLLVLMRGMAMSAAAALPLWVSSAVSGPTTAAILGIGIFAPTLYELGWRTDRKFHALLDEGIEFAEVYWGAFFGLALASALLNT